VAVKVLAEQLSNASQDGLCGCECPTFKEDALDPLDATLRRCDVRLKITAYNFSERCGARVLIIVGHDRVYHAAYFCEPNPTRGRFRFEADDDPTEFCGSFAQDGCRGVPESFQVLPVAEFSGLDDGLSGS
jgi:hypothetical protein